MERTVEQKAEEHNKYYYKIIWENQKLIKP